jgi:hypothetical protein
MMRLALAGCTVPEIAAITGHSRRDAQTILDANYFHRDQALAESAMRKLETRFGNKTLATENEPKNHDQTERPETRDPGSHGPRLINTAVTKADHSLSEIGAIDPRR